MNAGKFNRQVTIQKIDTTAVDELGEPIPNVWAEVAKVWASIRHVSGLETIKSNADVSVVKAGIRIRYRTDITAGMRVLYGTAIYDIRAVMPDEARREYVDLVCEVGANNG